MPPTRCIKAVLDSSSYSIKDIDEIALYTGKSEKARDEIYTHIKSLFGFCPKNISLIDHHLCHAASSYYASGFKEATIVNFDWSGDGISTSIWQGIGKDLKKIEELKKPNSLGIFYSAMTQFLGFERGDDLFCR